MLIFRCLGSRQLSLGRQHASRVHRIALRTFSINASNPALPKKLDLASRGNDYISIHVATDGKLEEIAASDLEVYPEFMSSHEQEVLLSAALKKLDSMASREERKKRREWNKANKATVSQSELRSRCSMLI